jgi:hypothetical protein
MSEARIISPSPTPTTNGEATFTPTSSPGVLRGKDDERIGAFELPHGAPDALHQRLALTEAFLDEMGDELGVGLGGERVTVLLESCPELREVLDDPVVDHGHGA